MQYVLHILTSSVVNLAWEHVFITIIFLMDQNVLLARTETAFEPK